MRLCQRTNFGAPGRQMPMFMPVTYQAPLMRESLNEMLNCPGFTPVLCATMSEVSVVPDTWMSVPLTVALVPLTCAVATVMGLRGVIPSTVKLPCR